MLAFTLYEYNSSPVFGAGKDSFVVKRISSWTRFMVNIGSWLVHIYTIFYMNYVVSRGILSLHLKEAKKTSDSDRK